MSADTVVVAVVVATAIGWLARRAVRTWRAGRQPATGCDRCGH
jgi:hypothetical protein